MMRTMRVVGLVLFLTGAISTALAVRASFGDKRPRSLLFGLATVLTVLVALAGLLLVFVPGFF